MAQLTSVSEILIGPGKLSSVFCRDVVGCHN